HYEKVPTRRLAARKTSRSSSRTSIRGMLAGLHRPTAWKHGTRERWGTVTHRKERCRATDPRDHGRSPTRAARRGVRPRRLAVAESADELVAAPRRRDRWGRDDHQPERQRSTDIVARYHRLGDARHGRYRHHRTPERDGDPGRAHRR